MDPQNPSQPPNQPAPQPGVTGLPPLQPMTGQQNYPQGYQPQAPQAPQPQQPHQVEPQPQANPTSYSVQYQQQQFSQPYQQQAAGTQPAVDYGNQLSNQQRDQFSIDYLNRIAPEEQKTVNKFAIFGLIGGVLATIVFVFIIFSTFSGPSLNSQLQKLDSRIQTLRTVTASQQTHLAENDISEANASLSSALGSMDSDLQALMKQNKIKKLSDKKAVTAEKAYLAKLTKTLDDDYQRGVLDRTYTTQMTYELSILRGLLAKLKASSSNSVVQELCTSSLKSIDLTLKAYSDFDASKS